MRSPLDCSGLARSGVVRSGLALLALAPAFGADVVRVDVERREPVLAGESFGDSGPYEKLVGTIHFAFDPENPYDAVIVDLDRAPRNAEGLVEAWGDLMVLRPVDSTKGSGTALLEVSNRGGKASLRYFNRGRYSADPTSAEHFGDGFLMRRGLTLIWVGWQFDVPEEAGRLRLHVPRATAGETLSGLVRSDWTLDEPAGTLALAHRNHVAYPAARPASEANVLTWRAGRLAERVDVPRSQWRFGRFDGNDWREDFAHISAVRPRVEAVLGPPAASEFSAGRIYELVYVAEDPAVVGCGLAAIRDTMSYAKNDPDCVFGVERGLGVGISQTGRFLRHFLYQGFNTDSAGRPVFDGLLVHTAGAGRGSFNHRFAQPSRDGHRYSAFFYPTDLFPFSGRAQRDPVTGQRAGLLDVLRERGHVPRIFYTNTGYEYWGRAGSLLHTSLDGSADVELLPEERIYHLASGQHFVAGFPPSDGQLSSAGELPSTPAWRGNPLDFLVTERALLAALQEWVEDATEPPPSAYPRIEDGSLVSVGEVRWPAIPGVRVPTVVHEAYRANYGPQWPDGLVTVQPPVLGQAYAALVSQVDALGNEIAGVPSVELLAPLATYFPWHLRSGLAGGNGELTDFYGTWVPLAASDDVRTDGDERPSVATLYRSEEAFSFLVQEAAADLVDARTLLVEDVPRVVERARAMWDWVTN